MGRKRLSRKLASCEKGGAPSIRPAILFPLPHPLSAQLFSIIIIIIIFIQKHGKKHQALQCDIKATTYYKKTFYTA